MQSENRKSFLLWTIGIASLLDLALGLVLYHPPLLAGGAIGLGYALLQLTLRVRHRRTATALGSRQKPKPEAEMKPRAQPADPNDTDALVEQMMAQGRYALLLRPQIASKLSGQQLRRATEALEERMALVPDGQVVLGQIDEALDDGKLEEEEIDDFRSRVVRVERFFLDRHPVTNRQFYEFVRSGGYEQMALWEESIWPGVLDFVDQTGEPGPRFWRGGRFEPGKEDHPVVGVSWYEAAAYARWLGKRLPTDAEWVKAGSWPVSLSATTRLQRRYPWGKTMERTRANLWGSGPLGTVGVEEFPEGVSVGGVHQLIGNVWEWMRGDFRGLGFPDEWLVLEEPMKNIRGGAFDTYFDNQATCQFQSGEAAVSRKPNIGFRCAVGVCDLMLAHTAEDAATPVEPDEAAVEEVEA